MKKVFFLLMVFSCSCIMAQECYNPTRQRGIELFNAGKKQEAKKAFAAAKSCPDKPNIDDLDDWINKCNIQIEPTECYSIKFKKAINLFNANKKQEAKKFFIAAKSCPDKPHNNKLNEWIKKCDETITVNECYKQKYDEGIRLLEEGKKEEAKQCFIAAKSCFDKPTPNSLDLLIKACDEQNVAVDEPSTENDSPAPPALNQNITLKGGTSVLLESKTKILARQMYVGQEVYFTILNDVKVNGDIAIPKGTLAVGIVTKAKKSKILGIRGELLISFSHIEIHNKKDVPLNGYLYFKGKNRVPISVITGIFFTPCLFIPGGKAYMPAKHRCSATIATTSTLMEKKYDQWL